MREIVELQAKKKLHLIFLFLVKLSLILFLWVGLDEYRLLKLSRKLTFHELKNIPL
jgi:hypothetical protein